MSMATAGLAQEVSDESTIADVLRRANAEVKQIVGISDEDRTFQNTVAAVDDMVAKLYRDAAFSWFMAIVSTDADERETARRADKDLEDWYVELSKRADLYQAIKAYAATEPELEGEAKRLLERLQRDYRRSGMELPTEQRDHVKDLELELNELKLEFQTNLQNDDSRFLATRDELGGVPDGFLDTLEKSGDLFVITMDYPTIDSILRECEVEATRQKTVFTYRRRGGRANVEILEKILKRRAEIADLLGYEHWADYVLEERMAKDAAAVAEFYDDLRPRVRKKSQADFEEFLAAKREHVGDPKATLQAWDFSFYNSRLAKAKYSVDHNKLREYFPLEQVTQGLFEVTERIYGIEYREVTKQAKQQGLPVWHEDVKLFEVWDKDSGKHLGGFYIDLHPREGKYGHAAKFGLHSRKRWADGTVQKPLCALVCNFSKPTADAPALLTHREVVTYFHEFGHCLHHVLADTDLSWFSGTSVARDFVEAPSQMFENWLFDSEVLNLFARHYKTGEKIAPEMVEGLVRARTLGSGMSAEGQIVYGLIDQQYHTSPDGQVDTTEIFHETRREASLFEPLPHTYGQAGFGHLMGYDAAYYGYMWSLVYAQDMYEHFRDKGMLSAAAGREYRNKILALGGTVEEMDMLKDYLGREPKPDAFLRRLGLEE
jgi:thimet oligopeptidase